MSLYVVSTCNKLVYWTCCINCFGVFVKYANTHEHLQIASRYHRQIEPAHLTLRTSTNTHNIRTLNPFFNAYCPFQSTNTNFFCQLIELHELRIGPKFILFYACIRKIAKIYFFNFKPFCENQELQHREVV